MPRASVALIRLAFAHLIVGASCGAIVLAHKGWGGAPWAWRLLPAHIECLSIGWTLQFILGVAYWMLPKWETPPMRGHPGPVWAAVLALNLGVLAVLAGGAIGRDAPGAVDALAAGGRAMELGAFACFATNAWPRIKRFGAG